MLCLVIILQIWIVMRTALYKLSECIFNYACSTSAYIHLSAYELIVSWDFASLDEVVFLLP